MRAEKKKKQDSLEKFHPQWSDLKNRDQSACPPADKLRRFYTKTLPRRERLALEDHLNSCPFCLAALERLALQEKAEAEEATLQREWTEIEKKLDDTFYASLESLPTPAVQTKGRDEKKARRLNRNFRKFTDFALPARILGLAAGLAVVCWIGLFAFVHLNRSPYFYLAEIKLPKVAVLRSSPPTASLLTEGLNLLAQKRPRRALEKLSPYLANHPNSYAANFYAGLSHLLASPKKLFGMPLGYKKSEVESGLVYLKRALALSRENRYYQEDCRWFLGKGYLMVGKKKQALKQFEAVAGANASNPLREKEAKELVRKLRNGR